ncbi:MAG: hypothetical protein D6782_11785 [Alphaproteobacteria bacterium]|nr:MAG: hypothetical protein D6782_11785 [Alphaproteobacteria bacterium]
MHRSAIAIFAVLAGFLPAACAKDPFVVAVTDCPAVAFVSHANTLTRFAPGRYGDAEGVALTAVLTGLDVACHDKGDGVLTDIRFDIIVKRGPAGSADQVTLPYFVAVARGGDTLAAKQVFQASVTLKGEQGRGGTIEHIRHRIPTNALARKAPHEVLIGFALSEDEAAYNVRY